MGYPPRSSLRGLLWHFKVRHIIFIDIIVIIILFFFTIIVFYINCFIIFIIF